MFDESSIQTAMVVFVIVGMGLLPLYLKFAAPARASRSKPGYVWLEVIGASKDESTEDTYRSAYLLVREGIRMELTIGSVRAPRPGRGDHNDGLRITSRITHTTESLRPHVDEIRSLEDFGRHATYKPAWVTLMKLAVHPEDADKATRVLERDGVTVERPTRAHPWH